MSKVIGQANCRIRISTSRNLHSVFLFLAHYHIALVRILGITLSSYIYQGWVGGRERKSMRARVCVRARVCDVERREYKQVS